MTFVPVTARSTVSSPETAEAAVAVTVTAVVPASVPVLTLTERLTAEVVGDASVMVRCLFTVISFSVKVSAAKLIVSPVVTAIVAALMGVARKPRNRKRRAAKIKSRLVALLGLSRRVNL